MMGCLLLWSIGAHAGTNVQQDVDHLLVFIETSDCTFLRNGREYDAQEAREHIQKKYNYAKDAIETTEQFIEYTATRSHLSGRPYRVNCAGQEQLTSEWLNGELHRYRDQQTAGNPAPAPITTQ
jgi:hypothetical protein